MKNFLRKIFLFGLLFLGMFSVTFLFCFHGSSRRIDWSLESNKTILITGDSFPECALNDSIVSDAVNLSSSADTYIYSYAKIRKFTAHNPQITQIILGFSDHNLQAANDSFFKDTSPGIIKFIRYYYLMDQKEIFDIFKANYNVPIKALGSCYQKSVIYALMSIRGITWRQMGLGGYRCLTRHHMKYDTTDSSTQKSNNTSQIEHSFVQIHYLQEIVKLCNQKKIQLILLSTPIQSKFKKSWGQKRLYFDNFCEENKLDDLIWNYSDYSMPDSCYADTEHLNEHGAELFSRMIRKNMEETRNR
jgi:hypothetical protein